MVAKLKFPKSTRFQLSLKLCWVKIALLVLQIFEFEFGGPKSLKRQIKRNEKQFDRKNAKLNGRQIKWDYSIPSNCATTILEDWVKNGLTQLI